MPLRPVLVSLSLAALFLVSAAGGYARDNSSAASQLSFGVDMARRGLWKEALFRFQEAEKLEPDNPRIQSNLAVAYEASGKFDLALAAYQKALKLAPNDKGIRTNYARFVEFYQGFKGEKKGGASTATTTVHKPAPAPTPPKLQPPLGEPSTPGDTPPPSADNRPPL